MTCTLAAKFGPGFVHTNCTCGVTEVSNRDVIPPPPRMPSNVGYAPTERPEFEPNPKKAFGATKPDLALVPPVGTLHQAMAHEAGAKRYGAYNWREYPVENMTYIAAAMRHLQAYLDGEDYTSDSEGMVHNLGAVMAGCAIVLDSLEQGILIDNRPCAGKASAVQDRLQTMKKAAEAKAKADK